MDRLGAFLFIAAYFVFKRLIKAGKLRDGRLQGRVRNIPADKKRSAAPASATAPVGRTIAATAKPSDDKMKTVLQSWDRIKQKIAQDAEREARAEEYGSLSESAAPQPRSGAPSPQAEPASEALQSSLLAGLSSKGIVGAVVMQEILGKPKSLR